MKVKLWIVLAIVGILSSLLLVGLWGAGLPSQTISISVLGGAPTVTPATESLPTWTALQGKPTSVNAGRLATVKVPADIADVWTIRVALVNADEMQKSYDFINFWIVVTTSTDFVNATPLDAGLLTSASGFVELTVDSSGGVPVDNNRQFEVGIKDGSVRTKSGATAVSPIFAFEVR